MLVFGVVSLLAISASGLNVYRPPTLGASELERMTMAGQVPGIGYVSRGYNIMFGNPHSTGNVDSGIMGAIFDLSNSSDGKMYNGYVVPNGVSVIASPTCTESFTYDAITGANSYSKSLEHATSFDAKGWGAAFSASTDYQEVYKTTTDTKSVYTSSFTQCACYSAALELPYGLPALTSNFKQEVAHMPLDYIGSNSTNVQFFYDFFTKYFGTHYITSDTLGGIFGTLSSMESYSYSDFSSSNLKISTAASYSCLGASAAYTSMSDTQKEQAHDFDSVTKSKQVYNIGGNLPSDGSPATWQKSLATNPSQIYVRLDVIPNLLTSVLFPRDQHIGKKKSALQTALNVYCQMISSSNQFGRIDCNGYPPDPALPGLSIIKGFYASNIDGEPKNPYNGAYSCDQGFTPEAYFLDSVTPTLATFHAYYCMNTTMSRTKKDQLDYFGGMYNLCSDIVDGSWHCNVANYFTGGCGCPSGYSSQNFGEFLGFNPFVSSCNNPYGFPITELKAYICYNPKISLSRTIIAGIYTPACPHSNCGGTPAYNNPYTKTTSCPAGFTGYEMFKTCCCDDNGKCTATMSTYMCINNIYPV